MYGNTGEQTFIMQRANVYQENIDNILLVFHGKGTKYFFLKDTRIVELQLETHKLYYR